MSNVAKIKEEYPEDYSDVNPNFLFDVDWIIENAPDELRSEWEDLIYYHIGEDDISVMWDVVQKYKEPYISCKFHHGIPYSKNDDNNKEMNKRIVTGIKRKINLWKEFVYSKKPLSGISINVALCTSLPKQYRVDGLLDLLTSDRAKKLSDRVFWKCIIHCWVMTEFPSQSKDIFQSLFNLRPVPKVFTRNLPDEMTVYRGGLPDGWSWSLSRERGEWFASLYELTESEYLCWKTKVKKEEVLFYTNDRQEEEVVFIPKENLIEPIHKKNLTIVKKN